MYRSRTGTVTSRPRRCGWFDAVMVRQAVKVGGIHGMALTKLDVLDGMETLKICTAYRHYGQTLHHLPSGMSTQAGVEPMSVEQAIRAVTIDPAWQLRMEDKIGSLEVTGGVRLRHRFSRRGRRDGIAACRADHAARTIACASWSLRGGALTDHLLGIPSPQIDVGLHPLDFDGATRRVALIVTHPEFLQGEIDEISVDPLPCS